MPATDSISQLGGISLNVCTWWGRRGGGGGGGGAVAQSVGRATSGEEIVVSIPAVAACSLLVRSVSV